MLARYHKRRAEAIQLLGGACTDCGSTEDLEFDHVNRSGKTGAIGKLFSRGKAWYLAELTKCQLLCGPCHRAKTLEEQSVAHGGGLTGKKSCYCDLCARLKRAYVRAWKAQKRDGSSAARASYS